MNENYTIEILSNQVEKIEVFSLKGSLHFGSLHPVILERHVWASIEGERVL